MDFYSLLYKEFDANDYNNLTDIQLDVYKEIINQQHLNYIICEIDFYERIINKDIEQQKCYDLSINKLIKISKMLNKINILIYSRKNNNI
jgi:hypothetical protein